MPWIAPAVVGNPNLLPWEGTVKTENYFWLVQLEKCECVLFVVVVAVVVALPGKHSFIDTEKIVDITNILNFIFSIYCIFILFKIIFF